VATYASLRLEPASSWASAVTFPFRQPLMPLSLVLRGLLNESSTTIAARATVVDLARR